MTRPGGAAWSRWTSTHAESCGGRRSADSKHEGENRDLPTAKPEGRLSVGRHEGFDEGEPNREDLRGLDFADEVPRKATDVDVLIGVDYYGSLVTGGVIQGKPDEPVALQTKLGFVLSGTA